MHGGASIVQVAETTKRVRRRYPTDKKPTEWVDEFFIYLWAIEDTSVPVERRDFRWVQDGERLDFADAEDLAWRHIASFTSVSGNLWQHIIETTGLAVPVVQSGLRRPTTGRSETATEGET